MNKLIFVKTCNWRRHCHVTSVNKGQTHTMALLNLRSPSVTSFSYNDKWQLFMLLYRKGFFLLPTFKFVIPKRTSYLMHTKGFIKNVYSSQSHKRKGEELLPERTCGPLRAPLTYSCCWMEVQAVRTVPLENRQGCQGPTATHKHIRSIKNQNMGPVIFYLKKKKFLKREWVQLIHRNVLIPAIVSHPIFHSNTGTPKHGVLLIIILVFF